jgi:2-polyprenyl-6-methoxyphenol hydroxylase-like FAD-dependent oxidoreductase
VLTEERPIAIVGAGLAGSLLAALLAKQGRKACAVNRRHDSSSRYSHPIKIRPISCADARDIVES